MFKPVELRNDQSEKKVWEVYFHVPCSCDNAGINGDVPCCSQGAGTGKGHRVKSKPMSRGSNPKHFIKFFSANSASPREKFFPRLVRFNSICLCRAAYGIVLSDILCHKSPLVVKGKCDHRLWQNIVRCIGGFILSHYIPVSGIIPCFFECISNFAEKIILE